MSVPTLPQVEEIIRQFYTSQDPSYQKSAQEYLHNLQKEPFAWELAPHLLSSQNENSQFFGAHTYQVKITRDWQTIPEERIEWMRAELIRWLVRFSGGPTFIRTKLCLALAAYAIRAVPTYWKDFIPSVYQDLRSRSSQTVEGSFITEQATEVMLLEFLTILPEELGRVDLEPVKKAKLSSDVSNGVPVVMRFIEEILVGGNIASKSRALVCLRSWVQYGISFEVFQPLLGLAMNSLLDDNTFDAAADVWSEIMSSKAGARHQDTICEGLMPCFASQWAQSKLVESIQAEDENVGKSLCQLLSTFGDNFSDWIAAKFLRPDIIVYLGMMMGFAGFPGYYAEDESTSDMTLNFWYMLQESISELPTENYEDTSGNGFDYDQHTALSCVSSVSNTLGLERESLQSIKLASIQVYSRLVEVLRKKLEFPLNKDWLTWARDVRQEFSGHRQEIADTLINSYHVLHQKILAQLIDTCSVQLDRIQEANRMGPNLAHNQPLESELVGLEATLYCLKALSEVVPHTESDQMPRFFSDRIFGRLPTNVVCRARETALGLIGSYADWFKVHPQFLLPVLNFVIPALEIPLLAPYAAKALKNICDTCRESLVEAIDAFMTVFANVEKAIDPSIKGSVVFSISTVIQTLPVERSISPLVGLLGDIFARSNECLETRKQIIAVDNSEINKSRQTNSNGESDLDPLTSSIVLQLGFLLSCCKGLQSPLDDEMRTGEERIQLYQRTMEDRARSLASGGMAVELLRSMEHIIHGAVMMWPHEPEVAEKTSLLVKTMMTVSHFSPLYLPLSAITQVIETGYQQHAFPCWLDACARVVSVYYYESTGGSLASKLSTNVPVTTPAMSESFSSESYLGDISKQSILNLDSVSNVSVPHRQQSPGELENERLFARLLAVMIAKTMEGMQSLSDMESHPDTVHSFFAVLSQFVRHAPLAFYSAPEEQSEALMRFAIAGLALQERLALKATLLFLIEFVNQGYEQLELRQRIDSLISRIGPQMLRGILLGIGGQVPRSMVPQLNDTLYPLVGKYPQECRAWMQTLLAESEFPSKHADSLSKEKFLKGILQTRSPKRFKDEVHQFSNKCRQLDGSMFGSAIYQL
ncbi:transportin-3 [Entomortierella parvispora]|uniref:Importin-13 n=1 Tax=Entomortierella parvispora TaxID=205924 RepID=A0A9P3HFP3_9FUNG|nr:transportin-3 [Entomortierella parvispora]